jgi:hypothetical protein
MDQIIELIVKIDLINYANYFLAGFVGSAAAMLRGGNSETPKKELISMVVYNGIIGGFTGMFVTAYSDVISFNYGVAGITGAVGIEKLISFLKALKDLKFIVEGDKK